MRRVSARKRIGNWPVWAAWLPELPEEQRDYGQSGLLGFGAAP